jgi:short chain dehydrogenase
MSRRMCAPPYWQRWMRLPEMAKSTAGSVTVECRVSQPEGTIVPAGRVIPAPGPSPAAGRRPPHHDLAWTGVAQRDLLDDQRRADRLSGLQRAWSYGMTIAVGKLDGRVAIVTGGARGMGHAHARALLGEGARVVIGDVLEPEGTAVAHDLGEDARFLAHPIRGFGRPEEVATTMLHIVCDATYSTAPELCVDGGILAGTHGGD